jgi:hypothetical protein
MYQQHRSRKKFILFPILALVAALIMGGIVMLLWNLILPDLTNWKPIRYWQAVGLLALCRILFGNMGGSFRNRRRWRDNPASGEAQSEQKSWKGRWMSMNHEERVKFREELRQRCRKG